MAPKRGRARAPQNHVPAIQSDYDTDVANMTDSAAPIPPRTNEELNLAVLKRHDPSVMDVIQVANFAVVYLFSPTSQQWEKCGIEGTLFVCELIPDEVPGAQTLVDRYNVIIINRKGMDNFSTDVFSTENVEITDEYVIIQVEGEDGTPQIYGLWIFSEPPPSSTAETRKITAEKIYQCAVKAETSRQAAEEEAAEQEAAASIVNLNGNQHAHAHPQRQEESQRQVQLEEESTVGRQIAMNELFAQKPELSHAQQLQLQQLPPHQQDRIFQFMLASQQQEQAQQQQQQEQQQQQQHLHQQQSMEARQLQHAQQEQQAQQAHHAQQAQQAQQAQNSQQTQHQNQMMAMLRGQGQQAQRAETQRAEDAQRHMQHLEQQRQAQQQQHHQQQQQHYQSQNHQPQYPQQQQQPQHQHQHQPDMSHFFQQNPQIHLSQQAPPLYPGPPNAGFPNEYSHMSTPQQQQKQQQQQRDVLGDLFRNAKQNYSA